MSAAPGGAHASGTTGERDARGRDRGGGGGEDLKDAVLVRPLGREREGDRHVAAGKGRSALVQGARSRALAQTAVTAVSCGASDAQAAGSDAIGESDTRCREGVGKEGGRCSEGCDGVTEAQEGSDSVGGWGGGQMSSAKAALEAEISGFRTKIAARAGVLCVLDARCCRLCFDAEVRGLVLRVGSVERGNVCWRALWCVSAFV